MTLNNYSCEYIDYVPNEHCRCFLLGYRIACGSKECIEAKENAKKNDNKVDAVFSVRRKNGG